MSKTDNKELEEAIQILDKFANNEMQRDKLERDNRCGGWKIGDIFKHLELNIAITTALKELKRLREETIEKDKIREKIEELEKEKEELENKTFLRIIDYINEKEKIDNQIKVLEELLKEE